MMKTFQPQTTGELDHPDPDKSNLDRVLFEQLFHNSPDAVILADASDTILRINSRFTELFGYSNEQAVGTPINQLIVPPEFRDQATGLTGRVLSREEVQAESLRMRRDGSRVHVEISGVPIILGDRQWGVIGIYRDITARKHAEDLLRQSEEKYRSIVESTEDGYFEVDLSGNFLFCNDSLARMFGIPVDELTKLGNRDYMDRDTARYVYESFNEVYRTGRPNTGFAWKIRRPDGERRYFETSASLFHDSNNQPVGFRGVCRDVTERAIAQNRLQDTERTFRMMAEHTGQLVYDYNMSSGQIRWLGAIESVMAFPADAMQDFDFEKWVEHIHPDDREEALELINVSVERDEMYVAEYRFRRADGEYIHVLDRGSMLKDDRGAAVRMIGCIADVTDRKLQQRALSREREHALVTLQSIKDGVIRTDDMGLVEYLNPVAEIMTGWSLQDARGRHFNEIFKTRRESEDITLAEWVKSGHQDGHGDVSLDHAELRSIDGSVSMVEVAVSNMQEDSAWYIGHVIVFRDVTEKLRVARKIEWQAEHDALTGLFNRFKFERDAGELLRDSPADQDHVLIFMDLDQFKVVNDSCGHHAGDELLRQLAQVLGEQCRRSDVLARLGGDEFALLLLNCSLDQGRKVAEKILEAVNEYRFVWQQQQFSVGISIGLVGVQSGASLVDAMKSADQACYVAKDKGRNQVHVDRDEDSSQRRNGTDMRAAMDVAAALNEDRFRLHFQRIAPVSDLENLDEVEILLRMVDRDGNWVLPDRFLPGAERYNKMLQIDQWVTSRVFSQLAGGENLQPAGSNPVCMINLSGSTLGQSEFLDFVHEQFDTTGLDPATVGFEITEAAAIMHFSEALKFVKAMRSLGCRIYLDDFGSGFSSFSYLKLLPIDGLKIDGGLVRDATRSGIDMAMLQAIVDIGTALHLPCIAEHVEDRETLDVLRRIGVSKVQGFYLHKPEPWLPADGDGVH